MPVKKQRPYQLSPKESVVNAIDTDTGVRYLLSDIVPLDENGPNELTEEIKQQVRAAVTVGRLEDGVRVVTYSLDAPVPESVLAAIAAPCQDFTEAERYTVRCGLDLVEQDSNLRFEPGGEDADIAFYKAWPGDRTAGGLCTLEGRNIVLAPDNIYTSLVQHETEHALGISHPAANGRGGKAGGKHSAFNKDTTLMSYHPGSVKTEKAGPFDVATKHVLFGEPKDKPSQDVIYEAHLADNRYFYSSQPMSINLSQTPHDGGALHVNGERIYGIISFPNEVSTVKARMITGTQFRDVLLHPDTKMQLSAVGNELINHLQGGSAPDILTPRGGSDVLTGGNNRDRFIIDENSGFDNIITDFKSRLDTLALEYPIAKVRLTERTDIMVDCTPEAGTQLDCLDMEERPVASVACVGVTPEKLKRYFIERNDTLPLNFSVIVDEPAMEMAASETHPSGLPAAHQTAGSRGK